MKNGNRVFGWSEAQPVCRLVGLLVVWGSPAVAQPAQPGAAILAVQADPRIRKADSLFLAREYKAASAQYADAAAALTLDPRSRYRYGMSLANLKDYEKAAIQLDLAAVAGNPVVLYNAGSVHAQLGHADTAFSYLDRSIAGGFSNAQILNSDSSFLKLRADPRYAKSAQRLQDKFTPCVNNPQSHQFDFWVGEWTVTNAAGQPAGTSSVQKILEDCVVLENWTDGQSGHGKSFNAFNGTLGKWQQFWVDQYGNVTEYRDSEWVGTSLRYTASTRNKQGAPVVLRMTFTPVDAETVRQQGESSTDGGKTWMPGYDLFYHRKKGGQ